MKSFKRILSLLLAAVIFCTCFTTLGISASAEGKITYSIEYDNGKAYVNAKPADSANYLTYTTDGSVPTAKSKKMNLFKAVSTKTLFRISEFTSDGKKISGIKFTVTPRVSDVKLTATYESAITRIELSCDTVGAAIYFTFDGSTPSENSILYTGAFNISQKTKIKAIAVKNGLKNSAIFSKTVTVGKTESDVGAKPENGDMPLSSDNTSYANSEKDLSDVVIEKDTSGVKEKVKYNISYLAESGYTKITITPKYSADTVYYTLDGTVPTKTNGKKYNGKYIKITEPSVLRISEFNKKGEKIRTLTTNVTLKCAPVEFICTDIYIGSKRIELKTATKGAKIYYTINGVNPTEKKEYLYTGPITVGESTIIKAIVLKDGYKDSYIKTEKADKIPFSVVNFDINDSDVKEFIDRLNEYRISNGLQGLKENKDLTYVANIRAKEISILYSHTRPSGDSYVKALSDFGVTTKMCTEIILATNDDPDSVVDNLVSSAEYKNTIISTAYDYDIVGVGVCNREGIKYWTILVAKCL